MGQELPQAAAAECTQARKRKMARTNQKPPVSKKRPTAACNRGRVGKEQGEGTDQNLHKENQKAGQRKRESQKGCHQQGRELSRAKKGQSQL